MDAKTPRKYMTPARYLYWFNDKEHFHRFLWGLTFLAFFTGLGAILVPQANADTSTFSCTISNGSGSANGNIFDQDTIANQVTDSSGASAEISGSDTAITNSDPYASGACSQQLGIFGSILCFFKTTLGQIISTMYCSFQAQLQGPLSILLTLFVAVIGVSIFTGMTRFTVREGIVALLKIALVWAFATNASWGIGIGYAFFMGLAEQASNLLIGAASSGGATTGGDYLTQPDKIIGGILNFTSTGGASGSPLTLPSTLTSSTNSNGLTWLFFLLAALLVCMPWVATFIITLIIQYLWIYARALLGYLSAMVLISFLFVLAPLFISFSLFKITRTLFEQWVKYLVSFSLQMVIVFGFLAMMNMVPLGNFFSEILGLLRQYDSTSSVNNAALPITFCSICSFTINASGSLMDATPPVTCDSTNTVIPLGQVFAQMDFVQAIVSQIIALWIIGYVMLDFMKNAPEFARDLGGKLSATMSLGAATPPGSNDPNNPGYLGLSQLENITTGAPSKFYNSSFGQSTMGRMLPGLGLLATGAMATMARSSTVANAARTSANKNVVGGTGADIQASAVARDAALQGASSGGTDQQQSSGSSISSLRAPLNTGRSSGPSLDATQSANRHATDVMDVDAQQVRNALDVVERYKSQARTGEIRDPLELANALRLLKDANDVYLISSANIFGTQRSFYSERATVGPTSSQATGPADAKTVQDTPSPVSYQDMREQVNAAVDSLKLQIEVQSQLQSDGGRVDEAQARLEEAEKQIASAKTSDSLEDVMQQLSSIQKGLI